MALEKDTAISKLQGELSLTKEKEREMSICLQETQTKMSNAVRRCEAQSREIEMQKQELNDLQTKFTEISRQKKKLEEMYLLSKKRVHQQRAIESPTILEECDDQKPTSTPTRRLSFEAQERSSTPTVHSQNTDSQGTFLPSIEASPRFASFGSFTTSLYFDNSNSVQSSLRRTKLFSRSKHDHR